MKSKMTKVSVFDINYSLTYRHQIDVDLTNHIWLKCKRVWRTLM